MTEERFKPLPHQEMTPEQLTMVEAITAGPRAGSLRGPFKALLHSPDLGNRVQHVGAYIRFGSSIPMALNELAILVAGRKWNAQFEFYAHRQLGLAAGMRPAVADAIALGRRPDDMDEDEALVWSFSTELLDTTQVSDETFAAAAARFGEKGVVDLVAALGYYSLVSMILNVDRVQLPPGEALPLKPLV